MTKTYPRASSKWLKYSILLTGDGNKTTYYRIGNESAPAPSAILSELILKGRNQTFDSLPTKYDFSNYSYTLFEATYRKKTNNVVEKPKDYNSFGMLKDGGVLTASGHCSLTNAQFINLGYFIRAGMD